MTATWTRRGLLVALLIGVGLALSTSRTAKALPRGTVIRNNWILRADD